MKTNTTLKEKSVMLSKKKSKPEKVRPEHTKLLLLKLPENKPYGCSTKTLTGDLISLVDSFFLKRKKLDITEKLK